MTASQLTATISIAIDLTGDGWTMAPPQAMGTPITNAATPGTLMPIQIMASNNALFLPKSPQVVDYLFIDPTSANTGMAFTLKGVPTDVGVAISSTNPSLIPTAAVIAFTPVAGPQSITEVYLQSSVAGQLNVGWI